MQMWRHMVGTAGRAALDMIYPPSCPACFAAVAVQEALCPACWRAMAFIERPYCERLGTPFAVDLGAPGLISPEAAAHPPVFGRARAVTSFEDGPSRRLVHRLKYGDRPGLARPMGRWMARAGADILDEAELLVPVPLHRRRLWKRQYNQAKALADAIHAATQVPVAATVLRRVKATLSQVGLTRSQRDDNLQGAFQVRPEDALQLKGRAIVLVDDVMTSGATANAASRVLLRAGAGRVDVLVFARVLRGL
ncbi:MAG: ComF family protein [Hyphomicrobiales bacterium]|nr:ComF family protein [Hyphomicrobiales bacterium]